MDEIGDKDVDEDKDEDEEILTAVSASLSLWDSILNKSTRWELISYHISSDDILVLIQREKYLIVFKLFIKQ